MMKLTDFGYLNNPAFFRRLDFPGLWGIFIQSNVTAAIMIIRENAYYFDSGKRIWLNGTHHCVAPKHLQRYLDEHFFRLTLPHNGLSKSAGDSEVWCPGFAVCAKPLPLPLLTPTGARVG
jgi:hypothetical protein